MAYSIVQQKNYLYIKFEGHVSNQELLDVDKELFEEWQEADVSGHLYDYLHATSNEFDEDEIKSIAVIDTNESFITGAIKVAIVGEDPDLLHFSHLYAEQMAKSDWEIKIFATLNEAEAFLQS